MIGSDVTVRVLEIRGDVVRVGVDAPRDVQVHREEVFHAVRAANLEAASAAAPSPAVLAGLRKRPTPQGGVPSQTAPDGEPAATPPADPPAAP
ncbi:carbon storage regulator, CsrA [Quadrisphaera granulorum]|uniref:Carbon storage regulator CsrA n=2 Tax=Quadrisphaera granulorum TaxID=317664 RepID=A0A316A522_9ACTN|nr:carbon storage regulator CsrA [Quadrisphaera granulorum]SZE97622.1 carbon storage regulator, CsrA [Quadrisphaera granulorum]